MPKDKKKVKNPHGNVMKESGVKPPKAYKNMDFLNSRAARTIRILCEYEETEDRLKREGIKGTILFFGSARSKTKEEWNAAMETLKADLATATKKSERAIIESNIKRLERTKWMCKSMAKCTQLAKEITEFLHTFFRDNTNITVRDSAAPLRRPSVSHLDCVNDEAVDEERCPVVVSSGGGPGYMEAANKGAAQVPGSRTMGMGITLPFEANLNPYVTEELAFEYHYFFTRKFWMMYHCQGIIVAPGGLGTIDELFEAITLKQTGKITSTFPIILFGPDSFWQNAINWNFLVDCGTISQSDVDQLCFTDDVEVALSVIANHIRETFSCA